MTPANLPKESTPGTPTPGISTALKYCQSSSLRIWEAIPRWQGQFFQLERLHFNYFIINCKCNRLIFRKLTDSTEVYYKL